LFCKFYDLSNDPGLEAILEMTRATDNVEKISFTSVHYVLKGLQFFYRDPKTKETDWPACIDAASTMLTILYDQAKARHLSAEDFARMSKIETLRNGLKLANLGSQARLREAAYDAGADIVLWTMPPDRKNPNKFHVGIQVHRDSAVKLVSLVGELRRAEGRQRNVEAKGQDVQAVGGNPLFGGWFLHDSFKLILCGSHSHPLEPHEFTLLSRNQIVTIVTERLSTLQIAR